MMIIINIVKLLKLDFFEKDYQSWGFRRNMKISDIIRIEDLISLMVETVR